MVWVQKLVWHLYTSDLCEGRENNCQEWIIFLFHEIHIYLQYSEGKDLVFSLFQMLHLRLISPFCVSFIFFYRNPPFQTQPKSILSLHEWQKTFISFACVQYRYGYLHFSPVESFDYAFLIFLVIWFSQYHTVWCQIITWSLFAKNKLGHRQRL